MYKGITVSNKLTFIITSDFKIRPGKRQLRNMNQASYLLEWICQTPLNPNITSIQSRLYGRMSIPSLIYVLHSGQAESAEYQSNPIL